MSVPRLIIQVLLVGTQIVGKAFVEAGRQAARSEYKSQSKRGAFPMSASLFATHLDPDARAGQVEAGAEASSAAGAGGTGLSATDNLTRLHRMTLDEAKMILNVKKAAPSDSEVIIRNYEHLFATNAPPAPKTANGKAVGGSGSFYLQSKIVRARERIEAEWEAAKKAERDAAGETAAEGEGAGEGAKEEGGKNGKDTGR